MTPKKGQYVRAVLYNGTQAEGYVVAWSDEKTILTSKNGNLVAVIQNTKKDLMLLEMVFPRKPEQTTLVASLSPKLRELEEEFQEIRELPSSDQSRIQKLVKLKVAMNQEEKKAVAQQLQQPITSLAGVRYASPFIKE